MQQVREVFALYLERDKLERTVTQLLQAGISPEDVSVLVLGPNPNHTEPEPSLAALGLFDAVAVLGVGVRYVVGRLYAEMLKPPIPGRNIIVSALTYLGLTVDNACQYCNLVCDGYSLVTVRTTDSNVANIMMATNAHYLLSTR